MEQGSIIQERPAYSIGWNSLIVVLAVGAFVGFFGWLLSLGINNWIITPVFCRSSDTASICSNANVIAWAVGYILMSIAGLFMLVRSGIFRPLLVVLAALVTLWTVGLWFMPAYWGAGLLWSTALFALAYALFAWLASIEKFIISSILIIVVVVLLRLLVML